MTNNRSVGQSDDRCSERQMLLKKCQRASKESSKNTPNATVLAQTSSHWLIVRWAIDEGRLAIVANDERSNDAIHPARSS